MPDLENIKFKIVVDSSSATSKLNDFSKSVKNFGTVINDTSVRRASDGIRNMGNSAHIASGAFRTLKGTIGNVKLSTVLLTAATYKLAQGLSKCIKQSMDFVETMNLFNVSMGDNALAAGEFAEKVQQAFGIDMAQWMRNQGVFQTLIEGFGVASEKADVMSQNLTQLGYDLSSLFNLPFADSMQKLQSGIAGELEPLRRLGYDLSQAKLQQIAYDHGIQQSVASMTQAEKSQLRYYAIMTQVTTAHGDMARTIMQPANMLRVFKENVVIAARSIGNLLIPMMQALLSVAIVVARGIAKVANVIASIFGIQTDWRGFMDDLNYNGGGGVADLADDLEDAGGAAGGAAKKMKEFKKQFLGFDKINNITLPTDPSSGGGGGGGAGGVGGGDFDLPLPTYDFLNGIEDAFAKAHPKIQKLFDDLAEDFKNGGNNIGSILGEAIRYGLWSIEWDNIKLVGNKIAIKLADGLSDFLETPYLFLSIGETLAQTLNTIFGTAKTFADYFHWESLGLAISDSINGFFSTFDFKLAAKAISSWAKGILDSAIAAVGNVDWEKVGEQIATFISNIDLPEITLKIGKLSVELAQGIGGLSSSFAKGIFKGEFKAIELLFKLKPNDTRTEAWAKLFLWLQQMVVAPTLTAKLQILKQGPGIEVADLFASGRDIEKDAKLNVKEGQLDPSLQKGGNARETFDHYDNKNAKVGLEKGKIENALKKGGVVFSLYGLYKDKKTKIGLGDGVIASGLRRGGEIHTLFDKYIDKKAKIGLVGSAGPELVTGIVKTTYDGFKSKKPTITVAGSIQQTAYSAKAIADSVYSKSATMTLYGSISQAAWNVYSIVTTVANTVTNIALGAIKGIATGGIYKNGKWQPVTAAASGGAFNTGQMFIAREAGPELVGSIGGHTAVMNNDQIVSSVAAGVASANSTQNALLRQLISTVQGGSQEVALEIDGTRFGTVAIRSINKVQRQQGRTLLNV